MKISAAPPTVLIAGPVSGAADLFRRRRTADGGDGGERAEVAEGMEAFLGRLLVLRAEAQNLQRSLAAVSLCGVLQDPQSRCREVRSAFAEAAAVYRQNLESITGSLAEARGILRNLPRLYSWCGDGPTQVENSWDRARMLWDALLSANPPPDADTLLREVPRIDGFLSEVVYRTASFTIPPRLNEHLRQCRIGQALDFHAIFQDELPRLEDRVRVLQNLRAHPAAVEGVVDPENGLVYHASPDAPRRAWSYGLILGAVLIGAGLILLLCHLREWLNLPDWPISGSRFPELMAAYAFLLAGGTAHIAVDALKQARAAEGSAVQALEDWLLWVHVKEASIVSGVAWLWVGLVGLTVSQSLIRWDTAFLVGYSIDSFADLFLQRFSSSVNTRTGTLIKALSPRATSEAAGAGTQRSD